MFVIFDCLVFIILWFNFTKLLRRRRPCWVASVVSLVSVCVVARGGVLVLGGVRSALAPSVARCRRVSHSFRVRKP